jgi:hypothetical protein
MLLPPPQLRDEDKKLAELILYISSKCANDIYFGATKLNKILYFSDFLAYGNWGRSITGAEYQNLPNGPAPRHLKPVRDVLELRKELAVQPVRFSSGKVQHRTIPLREPDLSLFSGQDIALVDEIIKILSDMDAQGASALSHRMVGWKMTTAGETIPYQTIFLSNEPLSEAEIKRGREIAKSLGMLAA